MALISSTTIITSVSLFHLTLAYFFLTNPRTVYDQSMVWVLGESMGMPLARSLDAQSPALGMLSSVLCLIGLSDLVSLSMPEEVCLLYYWGSQAPLRGFFSFFLVLYTFLTGPGSPFYSIASSQATFAHPSSHNPNYTPSTWGGDMLKNRVFFTFFFLEMVSWFWVWVTLREERYELVMRMRTEEERKAKRRGSSSG